MKMLSKSEAGRFSVTMSPEPKFDPVLHPVMLKAVIKRTMIGAKKR